MIFAGTCFFLDFSFIPDCRSLPAKQGVLNGVFEMATYRHYPSRIMSRGYFAAFAVAAAFAAFTVVNAEPDFNEAGPWQSFPSYTVINDTSIVSAPSFVLSFDFPVHNLFFCLVMEESHIVVFRDRMVFSRAALLAGSLIQKRRNRG